MRPLEPLAINLQGTTLIEASAGTGKTYTITALFLRILLEKQVSIDKILVVTFTIAATEELRIKITQRVLLALAWLHCTTDEQRARVPADDLLVQLLQKHNRLTAIKLLEDAASRLDEASVYTIDAFCMRVLQDHAFETAMPYRTDFVADDLDIKTRAAQDFWRHSMGTQIQNYCDTLATTYKSPDGLLQAIERIYRYSDAEYLAEISAEEIALIETVVHELHIELKSVWTQDSMQIKNLLISNEVLNKNSYKTDKTTGVFNKFSDLLNQPVKLEKLFNFELLTTSKITKSTRKNQQVPAHRFFDLCQQFAERHAQWLKMLGILVQMDAVAYIRHSIRSYKESRSILHFEDLRVRLFESINGPSGQALAAHIRQRWPYGLIDEFQDTDPQQYHIFNQVYGGQPEKGLFLIGDPKQAIYSFRGADIFAYILASRDTNPENRHTLDTNWRSSNQYVSAVNTIFSQPDAPFVFNDEIPFYPVKAAGNTDKAPLKVNGENVVPLQFWLLQPPAIENQKKKPGLTAGVAARQAIAACACNIRVMLEAADNGDAFIGDVPVCASDIAVLVRTNHHAEQVQLALRHQGVRSVRLATSGVFESSDSKEVLLVLKAITEPARTGLVRAALSTEMLGYTASEIDQLNHSESGWDSLITDMLEYNDILNSKGIIACLQRVYVDMRVPQRLLAQPGGEQKLTNILQISEILQVASRNYATIAELLQWMAARIDIRSIDEELLLRLESDENLVKIVTIHKSKGLEYPIVYMPVPWGSGPKNDIAVFHEPDSLKVSIDLGSDQLENSQQLSDKEDFAESLRVTYVALTRAKNLCVLCWGPVANAQQSSLGYLLHPRVSAQPLSDKKDPLQMDEVVNDLECLADQANGGISIRKLSAADFIVTRYQSSASTGSMELDEFKGSIRSDWRISSYTGLLRNDNSERPDHDSGEAADGLQAEMEVSTADRKSSIDDTEFTSIFQIPAGSRTGEFLHYVFENIDFTHASGRLLTDTVTDCLSRYGNLGRHEAGRLAELTEACCMLVTNTLNADLGMANDQEVSGSDSGNSSGEDQALQLNSIAPADRLNELEFYFSVTNASVDDITRILSTEQVYRHTAVGLSFSTLTGLMHGYIDMVVRRNGRDYIVDYKSNLLGSTLDSYGTEFLRMAIQSHRYDLQYLIYTVALHRYLRNVVPDYQYNEHFGGVYYLFLRGMREGRQTGIWFDKPPLSIVSSLDKLFGLPQQFASQIEGVTSADAASAEVS